MSIYTFLLVAFIILLIIFFRKQRSTLDFPGPPTLPIIGNHLSLYGKNLHTVLNEWALKYGEVFKMTLFGREYVVVNRTDSILEMLVARGNAFAGRPARYTTGMISQGFKTIATTNNMALHKGERNIAQYMMNMYGRGMGAIEEILDNSVHRLLDGFADKEGNPFDPKPELCATTSLTIFMVMCGQNVQDEDRVVKAATEMTQLTVAAFEDSIGNGLLNNFPAVRYIPGFPTRKFIVKCMEKRDKLATDLINELAEKAKASDQPSLLKGFLGMIGEKYGEGEDAVTMDMEILKCQMMDLLTAGIGTTTGVVCVLFDLLQHHPDKQQKAFDEILEKVGETRRVRLTDRDSLPYVRALILEGLRYSSIVPTAEIHVTLEDTELCGRKVPKNSSVMANLWALHHDPELWGDPWAFRPERFLDDDEKLVPADHPLRKGLMPFGAGPRVCAAEILALQRLFLLTASVIQRFQLIPPDGVTDLTCDGKKFETAIIIDPPSYQLRAVPRI